MLLYYCTRSVPERLVRQKGSKHLGERWVNANERWQSAARTVHGLYEDAWGALGGRLLCFLRPSCARLRFHPDPPSTSSDRPPFRTLTERSSGAPPRTLENFANFCLKLSPTLCVLRRPLTTTDDIQRSTGAPLQPTTFVCVQPPFHER